MSTNVVVDSNVSKSEIQKNESKVGFITQNKMKKVHGNDSFQRMNYLYQISKHIAGKNSTLSSYYGNLIVNVAKKNVLKINPDIKRQLCKKCRCMLIHNETATMKMKSNNGSKIIQLSCNTCGTKRNFPSNKNREHRIWLEDPKSVVEVMN